MLFAGWEVRIMKNCDRGFGRVLRAAFSSLKSQIFTKPTDPKPQLITYLLFPALYWVTSALSLNWLTNRLQTIVKNLT